MSRTSHLFCLALVCAVFFASSSEARVAMAGRASADKATESSTLKATSTKSTAATSTTATATTTTSAASSTATVVSPLGSATDVFYEDGACKASWTPAASGTTDWESMSIELMTGSNLEMVKLATVATGIDGTDASVTSYSYACPDVTPNAAIYFLQYTHGDDLDPTWTTRFTIATASGNTTEPSEANQPEGGSPAIPWGTGKIVTTATASTSDSSATTSTQTSSASSTVLNTSSSSEGNGSHCNHQWTALAVALPALAVSFALLL